jgi:hypothetical protein
MNKIVYNACYGGFSLSDKAYELYAELAGIKIYPEKDSWCTHYYTSAATGDKSVDDERKWLYSGDMSRHDTFLVQTVEQLGDEANGSCAKLRIYETDSDRYIIEEYDGNESVVVSYDNSWVVIK